MPLGQPRSPVASRWCGAQDSDGVAIFEINETADGQLYLVMAHYGGETLKEPDHSCSVHAPLLRQRFPGVSDCGLGNAGFVSTPLGEPDGVSIEGSSL